MEARRTLLGELIDLKRPAAEIARDLAHFPWDSDELVELTSDDVLRVLRAYLAGSITGEELAAWADVLEVRDDIGLAGPDPDFLREFLADASTPTGLRPVTPAWALDWLHLVLRAEAGRPLRADRDDRVIAAALAAAVTGPFFPDWEFETLFGLDRDEVRAVLARWLDSLTGDNTDLAVTNALNHLVGYPHDQWDAWHSYSDASPAEVEGVLRRWRQRAVRSASTR